MTSAPASGTSRRPAMPLLTRTTYGGFPCIKGELGSVFSFDLDWNTHRFGLCLGWKLGRRMTASSTGYRYNEGWMSGCLDWFAPLGEPNRLYLNGPRWCYMLGLPDNRDEEPTDETVEFSSPTGRVSVPGFQIVKGRWRLTQGQRWTPDRQWWGSEWSWFTRHPRNRDDEAPRSGRARL